MSETSERPETLREEVRPGLTMERRRVLKEDGRYLIYYTFHEEREAPSAGGGIPELLLL